MKDLRSGRTMARAPPTTSGTLRSHPTAGTRGGDRDRQAVDLAPRSARQTRPDPRWPQGRYQHAEYAADGRIVTAGSDRTVQVWNPANGSRLVLRGHQDEVDTARFAPGGSQVLSVSDDGTLRLWDARSGAALAVLDSGGGPLQDFAVSRDGRIATLSKAGVVRVVGCEVCGSLQQVRTLARSRSTRSLTPQEQQRLLGGTG